MPTFNGKKGDDVLVGSDRNDFMHGRAGNDQLSGRAGDDEIHGWIGNDRLFGEAGNDRLYGEDGDDYLDGGDGNDTLLGGNGNDELVGYSGADNVYGGAGDDFCFGREGNDEIIGSWGADHLHGATGSDRFFWDSSDDSNTALGIDLVADYKPAEGDVLWLGLSFDANSELEGRQYWEYSSSTPTSHLSNGNGQVTIGYSADGSTTTVSFYDNDGDFEADFIVNFHNTNIDIVTNPQFYMWVQGDPSGWTDPAIIYPGF